LVISSLAFEGDCWNSERRCPSDQDEKMDQDRTGNGCIGCGQNRADDKRTVVREGKTAYRAFTATESEKAANPDSFTT